VEFDGRKVTLLRKMPNSVPPKSYRCRRLQGPCRSLARGALRTRARHDLPGQCGGCDAGTGAYEGKRDHGFMLANNHFITPETDTTSHYLWTICTTAPRDSGVPEVLFDQFFDTITEDEVTLQAQQERIDDAPLRGFVGIASDGAVNQTRRLLGSMQELEQDRRIPA
jgi:vanillate O-demethylase monooxygenase subunit